WRQNDLDKVAQLLHQALEVDPDNPAVFARLAELCEQQEQWDQAITYYRKVAELQPDARSAAYGRIGDLLIQQQRYREAEEVLQKAVQDDPANAGACFSLGFVYEQLGALDQALQWYIRATDIAPKYGDAYIALTRTYGKQNNVRNLAALARRVPALR